MKIDILYPVRDMRVIDCQDLNISMKFFLENKKFDINFCVFDVGHNKSENKLKENINYDFKYGYQRWENHYGLSKAINLGMKELVETDMFIISGVTSIVPEDIIELAIKKYEETNFLVFGREHLLKDGLNFQAPILDLVKKENFLAKSYASGMFKILKKGDLLTLGGYEESYIDNENNIEEADFIMRNTVLSGDIDFIKNGVNLLRKYSDKKFKTIENKEKNILRDKIKMLKELGFLEEKNCDFCVKVTKKRPKKKSLLIKHLYSLETSL